MVLMWRNVLWAVSNYFSIKALLKSIFTPWRQLGEEKTGSGFDLGQTLTIAFVNFVMRVVGFIMRLLVIVVWLIVWIFVFLVGPILILLWTVLPVLCVGLLVVGISLIFV